MRTELKYHVSIESNENSESISYFKTKQEAINYAIRIKRGLKQISKEYKAIENPFVLVYNVASGEDVYIQHLNISALK